MLSMLKWMIYNRAFLASVDSQWIVQLGWAMKSLYWNRALFASVLQCATCCLKSIGITRFMHVMTACVLWQCWYCYCIAACHKADAVHAYHPKGKIPSDTNWNKLSLDQFRESLGLNFSWFYYFTTTFILDMYHNFFATFSAAIWKTSSKHNDWNIRIKLSVIIYSYDMYTNIDA